MKDFDFLKTKEGRAKFVCENESGLYSGKTSDGLECRVYLDEGIGLEVDIEQPSKPDWWEVNFYDTVGNFEGQTYERRR